MSIRYKIILNLLLMTAVCLGIYIWLAKSVFERDKELSIFEAASKTSSAQALAVKAHLDETVSFAASLAMTLSSDLQSFSEVGSSLFAKKNNLVSFGVLESGRFLSWQTKDPAVTAAATLTKITDQDSLALPFDPSGKILLRFDLKSNTATPRKLVLVVDLQGQLKMLSFKESTGGSFLAIGSNPLSNDSTFPFATAQKFLQVFPDEKSLTEQTTIQSIDHQNYLLSSKLVQFGTFRIITAVPKGLAFAGLDILYRKSVQFFGLIICIVLFASIFMTQTLLKNLDRLTIATKEIAKGHFNLNLGVQSNDEFGSLGSSFESMSHEIGRLVVETKEKARMEGELRTAQTVQENLFPTPGLKSETFELHGLYRSASECGGDWWYHFTHASGTYVFICDATGHGAPAALITAAAKAAVNLMKRDANLDLQKLVEAFNYALYETAKGNLLMTGFVLYIKDDFSLEYVNASHEPPMLMEGSKVTYLIDPIGPRFGQAPNSVYWIGRVQDLKGKFILMYTDGITGQHNKDGRELGERQFNRHLKQIDLATVELSDLNSQVFDLVDHHRGDVMQEDDLTIVTLRFGQNSASQAESQGFHKTPGS